MNTQTRHALQGDAFATATQSGLEWLETNRTRALRIAVLALAVILVIVAAILVYSHRKGEAESSFAAAMETYNTPVQDSTQPMPPGVKTFASAAERAKAANPQFLETAKKYGSFREGEDALYFAGLTYAEMGQTAQAEAELRKAAGVRNRNIAALSKLALANLLGQAGQTAEAAKLYRELIAKPTATVPAATAQLQMAAMYEAANNTAEANKIYTEVKDKNKDTAAGEIATQRLTGGK